MDRGDGHYGGPLVAPEAVDVHIIRDGDARETQDLGYHVQRGITHVAGQAPLHVVSEVLGLASIAVTNDVNVYRLGGDERSAVVTITAVHLLPTVPGDREASPVTGADGSA